MRVEVEDTEERDEVGVEERVVGDVWRTPGQGKMLHTARPPV